MAHPHSRGENIAPQVVVRLYSGSSPLTRGKLVHVSDSLLARGLIPTHAGKTHLPERAGEQWPAHPHSRGENRSDSHAEARHGGSSPLTRGKRTSVQARATGPRLIPTHAGKTASMAPTAPCPGAHPHSRGENASAPCKRASDEGSSPLTRGKRSRNRGRLRRRRLIPTHAGKTLPDLHFYRADRSDLGKP